MRTLRLTLSLSAAVAASLAFATGIVYQNNTPSGTRFRTSGGMFDDVLVPASGFPSTAGAVQITRIGFGMELLSGAPAPTTNFYEFGWVEGVQGSDLFAPQAVPTGGVNFIGTRPDARDGGGIEVQNFLHDGTTYLPMLMPSSLVTVGGLSYYAFFAGNYHRNARSGSGWQPTSASPFFNQRRPDFAAGMFQLSGLSWNPYIAQGTTRDTFWLEVEGKFLPHLVTGTLELQSWNFGNGVPFVFLQVRQASDVQHVRLRPAADGSWTYSFFTDLSGPVEIVADRPGHLRRKLNVVLANGASNVNFVLPTADVNDDGEVDLTDIDLIISAYLTIPRGTGYVENSDVDSSLEVDLTDIDLAIGNYLLANDN